MDRWRFLVVPLVISCLAASVAAGQMRGTIFGPGVRQYPIALAPLTDPSMPGKESPLGVQFVDIAGRDLEISGLFRIVPRDSHIESPGGAAVTADAINFDSWSVIGALALVKGTVEQTGDLLFVEVRLFDVGQRQALVGRRYRGGPADVRRMANRFADEIMQVLTGEKGPFDSRIAFTSTRGGRLKDVYVMSPDGGDLRKVTSGNTLTVSPSWAPHAESLIVTSYLEGSPNLFSVDLASARWSRVSNVVGLDLGGVWSPDGTRLAVSREQGGNSDIVILARDGSLVRRLTDHWAIDVSPSWSPDGDRLAFCSSRGGSPQIYVIDVGGGEPRRVTKSGAYNTSPRWSPKGDRLAYTSRVSGHFQVFTVALDGSDVRQVTNSRGDNEDPSWSPDGRYLVFSSTRGGRSRLYVTDKSGASQVELTAGEGGDTSPTWSGWLD